MLRSEGLTKARSVLRRRLKGAVLRSEARRAERADMLLFPKWPMHPRRDGPRDVGEQTPRETDSQVSGKRRIVIITGLSGAGKSNAMQAFEDAGYFCIDNLPPRMIPAVMETTAQGKGGPDGVVVVVDIRGRRYFGEELERDLEAVESGWERRILFIESDDPTLVRRYKESRRPHPAARNGDVLEAIRDERRDLSPLRGMGDP